MCHQLSGKRGNVGVPHQSSGTTSCKRRHSQALPSGLNPDVILVSCAGRGRKDISELDLLKVLAAKRRGEELLRASGLGYTIIRPAALVEEPGGYKALVFDQVRQPCMRLL